MIIQGMGLNFAGEPLFQPVDEDQLAKSLVAALEDNAPAVQALTRTTSEGMSFRGEVERQILDLGDPRVTGWTYLINSADPQRMAYAEILKPLAEQRGMPSSLESLRYNGETPDDWFDWLQDNYFALKLEGKQPPGYILILGSPGLVPFHFQSVLSTVASVGRLDFDSLDDLRQYVDKLIRIERAPEPLTAREVLLFAPDAGLPDPTYYSHKYMTEPLAMHITDELGLPTRTILGKHATKENLLAALRFRKPVLVYTASHGLGAINQPLAVQKRYNGALYCQKTGQEKDNLERLFTADDVPRDEPFLEGAVFFQFACFGYGTPAESDYAHWYPNLPVKLADEDFVAALPKRLLAHPRGPIAFIGHLDTAFMHGFVDVENPLILERWHSRLSPFMEVVDRLLGVQPSGLALREMGSRYGLCNALITSTYDRQKRGKLTWNEALERSFLDNWITRGDAQNYMIFGDPATRLRILDE